MKKRYSDCDTEYYPSMLIAEIHQAIYHCKQASYEFIPEISPEPVERQEHRNNYAQQLFDAYVTIRAGK